MDRDEKLIRDLLCEATNNLIEGFHFYQLLERPIFEALFDISVLQICLETQKESQHGWLWDGLQALADKAANSIVPAIRSDDDTAQEEIEETEVLKARAARIKATADRVCHESVKLGPELIEELVAEVVERHVARRAMNNGLYRKPTSA